MSSEGSVFILYIKDVNLPKNLSIGSSRYHLLDNLMTWEVTIRLLEDGISLRLRFLL